MDRRLQNEIEHGKYLLGHGAGEIWGWESPAGKERWKRRVSMLTSHITKDMKVLEIGCGTGYFSKELAKLNADTTCIDISPELICEASENIKSENICFLVDNAYMTSFPSDSFDTIVGSSVLHHLDTGKAFSEIFRVLKPGGSIYFTEPNMLNPQIALQKNIPYIKKKLGDSPDETAFFKWSLKNKLVKHGFKEIEIIPFDFLHPKIPEKLIPFFRPICMVVEKLPLMKEIAGSLYIKAKK